MCKPRKVKVLFLFHFYCIFPLRIVRTQPALFFFKAFNPKCPILLSVHRTIPSDLHWNVTKVGRPKEPPLESPSEPYVSLGSYGSSPTDGNIQISSSKQVFCLFWLLHQKCSALSICVFFYNFSSYPFNQTLIDITL